MTTYKELYWADRYVSDDCIAYYRFPSAPVVTRVPVSIGAMGVGGQVTTFLAYLFLISFQNGKVRVKIRMNSSTHGYKVLTVSLVTLDS